MEKIDISQVAEFLVQASRVGRLTKSGFQGIINNLDLFSAFGELCSRFDFTRDDTEKIVRKAYTDNFFPGLPEIFHYFAYGACRLIQYSHYSYRSDISDAARKINFTELNLSKILEKTSFSSLGCPFINTVDDVGEKYLRKDWGAGIIVNYKQWIRAFFHYNNQRSLIRIENKHVAHTVEYYIGEMQESSLQLVLFPQIIEFYKGTEEEQSEIICEIARTLGRLNLKYSVRKANIWEALFIVLSRFLALNEDWPKECSLTLRTYCKNDIGKQCESTTPLILTVEEWKKTINIKQAPKRCNSENIGFIPIIEIANLKPSK